MPQSEPESPKTELEKTTTAPSDFFRTRLREVIDRYDLSTQRIANESLVPRSVIYDVISGKRHRVGLDEVLAICSAIDVAPVYMFLPPEDVGLVRIGRHGLRASRAREWICGRNPFPHRHGRGEEGWERWDRYLIREVPAKDRRIIERVAQAAVEELDDMRRSRAVAYAAAKLRLRKETKP
jgi:hypothetical protein